MRNIYIYITSYLLPSLYARFISSTPQKLILIWTLHLHTSLKISKSNPLDFPHEPVFAKEEKKTPKPHHDTKPNHLSAARRPFTPHRRMVQRSRTVPTTPPEIQDLPPAKPSNDISNSAEAEAKVVFSVEEGKVPKPTDDGEVAGRISWRWTWLFCGHGVVIMREAVSMGWSKVGCWKRGARRMGPWETSRLRLSQQIRRNEFGVWEIRSWGSEMQSCSIHHQHCMCRRKGGNKQNWKLYIRCHRETSLWTRFCWHLRNKRESFLYKMKTPPVLPF
jgi:hypothetical protein